MIEQLHFDALSEEYSKRYLKIDSAPKDYTYKKINCPAWLIVKRKSDWSGLYVYPLKNMNDDYTVSQPRTCQITIELETKEDKDYDGTATDICIADVYQEGFEFAHLSAVSEVTVEVWSDENDTIWCQYEIEDYDIPEGSGVTLSYENGEVELFGEIGVYTIKLEDCTDINSITVSKETEIYEYGRCYIKVYTSETHLYINQKEVSNKFSINIGNLNGEKQIEGSLNDKLVIKVTSNTDWVISLYRLNSNNSWERDDKFFGKAKPEYNGHLNEEIAKTIIISEKIPSRNKQLSAQKIIISGHTTSGDEIISSYDNALVYKPIKTIDFNLGLKLNNITYNVNDDIPIAPSGATGITLLATSIDGSEAIKKMTYNSDGYVTPITGFEGYYPLVIEGSINNLKVSENTTRNIVTSNIYLSGTASDGVLNQKSKNGKFILKQEPYVVGVYEKPGFNYDNILKAFVATSSPDGQDDLYFDASGNTKYVINNYLYDPIKKSWNFVDVNEYDGYSTHTEQININVPENTGTTIKPLYKYDVLTKIYNDDNTKKYGYYSATCIVQQDYYCSIITSPSKGSKVDGEFSTTTVIVSANTVGVLTYSYKPTPSSEITEKTESFKIGENKITLNIGTNIGTEEPTPDDDKEKQITIKTINNSGYGEMETNFIIYQRYVKRV